MAPKGRAAATSPKTRRGRGRAAAPQSPPGHARSPGASPRSRREILAASPRSPMPIRSAISLPIDPEIEKGYMQAILQRFDRASKDDKINLPEGYKSWQSVPGGLSNYLSFQELEDLQDEIPMSERDCHDLGEPVKLVGSSFAQASGMLSRTIRHDGHLGRVEGMRMGCNTMQLYYVVRFSGGGIQHFQNFEIEKLVVDQEDFTPSIPSANGMKKRPATTSASPAKKKRGRA